MNVGSDNYAMRLRSRAGQSLSDLLAIIKSILACQPSSSAYKLITPSLDLRASEMHICHYYARSLTIDLHTRVCLTEANISFCQVGSQVGVRSAYNIIIIIVMIAYKMVQDHTESFNNYFIPWNQ